MVAISGRGCKLPSKATADSGNGAYNQGMNEPASTLASIPAPSASRRWPLLAAGLVLSLPASVAAQVAGYQLDPVHTRVMFAVSHAGFSHAIGTVSGSNGVLAFDPNDWSSAQLSVEVPLQRLDMGDENWTRAVLARRLLDVEHFPLARFVSDHVEQVDPTHGRMCGILSLHGANRPLCMQVVFNQLKRHPLPPFRRTSGFSATAMLKRSDFGIDDWKSVIGDEVELRIEAEAVRKDGALEQIESGAANKRDSDTLQESESGALQESSGTEQSTLSNPEDDAPPPSDEQGSLDESMPPEERVPAP